MGTNRRNFLKNTGLLAFVSAVSIETIFAASSEKNNLHNSRKGLTLSFLPYELQLHHVFTLANSSRKTTPDVLTRIE